MRGVTPQHVGFRPDHGQGGGEILDSITPEIAAQQPHRRAGGPSITFPLARNGAGAAQGGGQPKDTELQDGTRAITRRGTKHDRLTAAGRLVAKGRLHEILPCL